MVDCCYCTDFGAVTPPDFSRRSVKENSQASQAWEHRGPSNEAPARLDHVDSTVSGRYDRAEYLVPRRALMQWWWQKVQSARVRASIMKAGLERGGRGRKKSGLGHTCLSRQNGGEACMPQAGEFASGTRGICGYLRSGQAPVRRPTVHLLSSA